ncbi:MAG: hypothetical protein KC492_05525 [Myxococcales bacterium]|nr:hypothetical protein [Myxococcales bacterium]
MQGEYRVSEEGVLQLPCYDYWTGYRYDGCAPEEDDTYSNGSAPDYYLVWVTVR